MSRFWEIVFCVSLLFRRHVCSLSQSKHAPSRELPLTARKTVFSHLNNHHLTRVRLRKNHESHGQDFTSRTNRYYMWDWTRDQHTAWATGKPYEVLGYFEKGKSTYPSSAHTYETTPSITCPVTEEKNLQFFNSRPRKVGFGGKNEIKRQEG